MHLIPLGQRAKPINPLNHSSPTLICPHPFFYWGVVGVCEHRVHPGSQNCPHLFLHSYVDILHCYHHQKREYFFKFFTNPKGFCCEERIPSLSIQNAMPSHAWCLFHSLSSLSSQVDPNNLLMKGGQILCLLELRLMHIFSTGTHKPQMVHFQQQACPVLLSIKTNSLSSCCVFFFLFLFDKWTLLLSPHRAFKFDWKLVLSKKVKSAQVVGRSAGKGSIHVARFSKYNTRFLQIYLLLLLRCCCCCCCWCFFFSKYHQTIECCRFGFIPAHLRGVKSSSCTKISTDKVKGGLELWVAMLEAFFVASPLARFLPFCPFSWRLGKGLQLPGRAFTTPLMHSSSDRNRGWSSSLFHNHTEACKCEAWVRHGGSHCIGCDGFWSFLGLSNELWVSVMVLIRRMLSVLELVASSL